ncbi:hypothetical protein DL98DRAFT_634496 [Cadophora sp. DSE1049]|nr:hypothetical protein DL98DRAFT_634496 [Cadophora sp. DSE1049]
MMDLLSLVKMWVSPILEWIRYHPADCSQRIFSETQRTPIPNPDRHALPPLTPQVGARTYFHLPQNDRLAPSTSYRPISSPRESSPVIPPRRSDSGPEVQRLHSQRSTEYRPEPRPNHPLRDYTVIVCNQLSSRVTAKQLFSTFSKYHRLQSVEIPLNKELRSRGVAYVKFEDAMSAMMAKNEVADTILCDRRLQLGLTVPRPGNGGHGRADDWDQRDEKRWWKPMIDELNRLFERDFAIFTGDLMFSKTKYSRKELKILFHDILTFAASVTSMDLLRLAWKKDIDLPLRNEPYNTKGLFRARNFIAHIMGTPMIEEIPFGLFLQCLLELDNIWEHQARVNDGWMTCIDQAIANGKVARY